MTILRGFCVFVVFLFPVAVLAQVDDEKLRERQRRQSLLIEQVTAELPSFRLAANRAYVYAKTGSIIHKADPKLAADLFRKAIAELIDAQMAAEADRRAVPNNELLTGQSTRPQLLNTIAAVDAEFALDSFYRTRPAAIEKAISAQPAAPSKISSGHNNSIYLAQSELSLEQSLMRRAAEQRPERAAELLKHSIKRGLSYETLETLKRLHNIDPETADALAAEVVDKLLRRSLTVGSQPDQQAIQISMTILSDFVRERQPDEKVLKLNDHQMRSLSDKLIAFHLDTAPRFSNYYFQSIIPIAEKLSPGSIKRLKDLERTNPNRSYANNSEVNELLQQNPTAEVLLSEAKRLPIQDRHQIYLTAANKMSETGNYSGALTMLNENFADDTLENAVSSLNWYYTHHLINQERYSDAERLIDEFPESNRFSALINLAQAAYGKDNAANRAYALSLLNKLRSQIDVRPNNANELNQLSQLITAYGAIEPAEAFQMFEPLVPLFNELSEASVVLYGFQNANNIQQGEMVIANGINISFHLDVNMFRKFAEDDLERTLGMIDALSRREMRVYLKLHIAENLAK
jgi:hypothetical protein